MLITRCPTCGTTFRIRPEQLNVRGGRVRCGKCHNAFSALDSLDELPDTEAEAVIAASTASAATPSSARAATPAPTHVQAPASPPYQPPVPPAEAIPVAPAHERESRPVAPPRFSTPAPTPQFDEPPPRTTFEQPAPAASDISKIAAQETSNNTAQNPPEESVRKDDGYSIDFDLGPSHDGRIEPTIAETTEASYSVFDSPPTVPYMAGSAIATLVNGLREDPDSDAVMKALEASITEAIEVRGLDAEFGDGEALDIDVNLDEDAEKKPPPVVVMNDIAGSRFDKKPTNIPLPTLPTIGVEETDDIEESVFDHGLPTEPLPEDGIDEPLGFSDELMDPGTVFLDDEVEPSPQKSRARSKPNWWALGSLGLLLLALAQGIFTFRMELARAFPMTRYGLEQVCGVLGCKVPYPKDADQILVEGTDLTPDASGTGHYRLIVTLRNKANYPQSWPQLELTLTDRFDRALSRRVLSPKEWVPANLATRPALDAQAEVTANVAISTDLPAAGYRVYTFYP